ncbi:hypothetical protein L9F63_016575 [Diploptera punctata]|uniref:Copper transport protein n=1 Tax=Diploptera punctata TaxID=6984 RepID=A0AAD8EHR8_DIPPU|nr:hypothetical protein L9F63_016575 [Diploptera punctata]
MVHHSTENIYHEDMVKSTAETHHHMAMSGHSLAFHGGYTEIILFEGWNINSLGGLIGSMIGIFFMATIYETLKHFREYLVWRTCRDGQYQAVALEAAKRETERIESLSRWSWGYLTQTAIYVVQMVISYFLMLIFMTYNTWLCFAAISGYAVGYFIFSWKKAFLDVTGQCH